MRPQSRELSLGQLKAVSIVDEIGVTPDGLVEPLRLHPKGRGEVGVEHDRDTADAINGRRHTSEG